MTHNLTDHKRMVSTNDDDHGLWSFGASFGGIYPYPFSTLTLCQVGAKFWTSSHRFRLTPLRRCLLEALRGSDAPFNRDKVGVKQSHFQVSDHDFKLICHWLHGDWHWPTVMHKVDIESLTVAVIKLIRTNPKHLIISQAGY